MRQKANGRTLQRTEATVHNQFEIAELALGEDGGRERLGLSGQLVVDGSIAGEEVLEDTAVGRIGHIEGYTNIQIEIEGREEVGGRRRRDEEERRGGEEET